QARHLQQPGRARHPPSCPARRATASPRAAGRAPPYERPSSQRRDPSINPMPPKLVASDLDGTLVRSDNTIDDRTRLAIATAEAAGAAWAFERAGGFGHEPEYVTRWPIPEDSAVDAIHALIDEPAVKLMLRHRG